jgi:predicted nucleic acid-binding protein
MIILDTNVVSELMRPEPVELVLQWLDRQRSLELHLTALTQAEILYGIERLPKGKRRDALAGDAVALFESDFRGRILPFDSDAAAAYAEIMAGRRARGRPTAIIDAQVAAIARSIGARLATRNTRDFEHCGVDVIDPWVAD